MGDMQSQKARKGKQIKAKVPKYPKGWREDTNAVPLPFSRPWDEFKYSEAQATIAGIGELIEECGLEHVLSHLELVCDEQAGLYGDGCAPVFPKDEHTAGIWAFFAKRFRDMHKFTVAYQPPAKMWPVGDKGDAWSELPPPKKKARK